MNLWYQSQAGPFSQSEAVLIGPISASSHYSWGSSFNFPVTVGGTLFVTVDLGSLATAGDTFNVTQQAGYVTFGSGLVYPSSGPVTAATFESIVATGSPSFVLQQVAGGWVPPGTTTYPVYGAQIQVSGAVPLTQVSIFSNGTLTAAELTNVDLWDEPSSAGPNFNPSQASLVAPLTLLTATEWRNTTNRWNVQNNDYLFITVDVSVDAVGGHTMDFMAMPTDFLFANASLPTGTSMNSIPSTILAFTPTPTFTSTPTATATFTPAPAPNSYCPNFGSPSSGDPYGPVGGSSTRASRYTLSATEELQAVAFYIISTTPPITNSDVRVAVYADNASSPSTLIVQSSLLSNVLTDGWNIVPIPLTTLPAGAYWLGAYVDISGTSYSWGATVASGGLPSTADWSTGAPANFTGGFVDPHLWAFEGICASPTFTPTVTDSPTSSPTATLTASPTPTVLLTSTPTQFLTFTPTVALTSTPTMTLTSTPTPTVPWTATPTSTMTSGGTATSTPNTALYLDQNSFNPSLQPLGMDVHVDQPGKVQVVVYNIAGEEVAKLLDQAENAGNYRVTWNGRNSLGGTVGNGIYFVMIRQPSGVLVRKVIVLK